MTKKEVNEEVKEEVKIGQYAALLNEAKENKRVKKLMPTFVEFKEKGRFIIGKYLTRTEVGGGEGKRSYYQYLFDTDDGLAKFHLGNVTDGEVGAIMKEGCVYYIEYLGQENITGGRRVNKFDVQRLVTEEEARIGGEDDLPF